MGEEADMGLRSILFDVPMGARWVVRISSGSTGILAVLVLWLLARTYSDWGAQEPFWRAFAVLFPVAIALAVICLYFLLRYPRMTIYADRVVVGRQTYRIGDIKALDLSVEERTTCTADMGPR